MNTSDITLKDLTYVLAVAEFKSFSRAAEACTVSQPALSKQIRVIEKTLGIPLFERNKRHVLLTDEGARFIEQARKVLDEAEMLIELTTRNKKPLSGPFRLGVIASCCPYLLPHFVGELRNAYPELKLIVKEGLTDNLIQELRQGNLDAVIAATTFEDPLLNNIPLYFEPFLLARHKQAGMKYKPLIEIKDIDTTQLLLLEDGHCLKDQTLELCSISEESSLAGFKTTSLETLLQMTAGGLGVSIIPALAIPTNSKLSDVLVFSEFKNKKNGRFMALYFRKSYPYTENITRFAQFIKENLPESIQSPP
jgi:LysR family transcriptional regulator, hydrogen peroxide-inducible genes activator